MDSKPVARNKNAEFEYFLLEHYESGIALQGSEIKSVRAGQVSLQESYIQVDQNCAWLVNAHIANYNPASYNNHEPKRNRQLLLHKKEITALWNAVRQKGVTVVPVKMYIKNGRAKLDIAVAKGKKLYDKREDIAKKDTQRDILRAMKGHE